MKRTFTMPDGEVRTIDFPDFKTPYNHDREFESERTALFCDDESLTKQEFREETDINVILKRFMRTGEPPPMALPEHFADLTGRTTYFDMATKIAEANELFYELPADKRAVFLNDPNRWADAVVQATEAGNAEALIELGIDVEIRQPQAGEGGTPPPGGSPAPGTPPNPSEAPRGAPPAGAPAGKSEPTSK